MRLDADIHRAVLPVARVQALDEDDDAGAGALHAIGITNQRETVCVWDPSTGEPLHRALVWQDRRTAARCDELREQGHEDLIRERTGLVIDPYFSGTKIEWLLRNVDGLKQRAREGRAVFGTIDSWLTFKLTGEFVTEPADIFPAIDRAFASGKPACVNVIIDQKPEGVAGGYEFLG